MKKYLLLIIFLLLIPFIANATYQQLEKGKIITVFDEEIINGTATATSSVYRLTDTEYHGVGYFQTGSGPDVTLTYDISYDGTNWITDKGTIASSFTSTDPAGGSLALPVAPLVRFKLTGNAGNGTDTAFTLHFMKQ